MSDQPYYYKAMKRCLETCAEPGVGETIFQRGEPIGRKKVPGCGEPVEQEVLMLTPLTPEQVAAGQEQSGTPIGFCKVHTEERIMLDPQAASAVTAIKTRTKRGSKQ